MAADNVGRHFGNQQRRHPWHTARLPNFIKTGPLAAKLCIDFSNLKNATMELEIHPDFGFSHSTRLAMSKSILNSRFRYDSSIYVYCVITTYDLRKRTSAILDFILPVSIWPTDSHGYWHFALKHQIWIFYLQPFPRYVGIPKFVN